MASNRTAALVLAVTAVVGISGGTLAAALTARDVAPSGTSSDTLSDLSASTAPAIAADPAVPYWATPGEIHDGDQVVPIRTIVDGALGTLTRISDGWLLTTRQVTPGVPFTAYVVRPNGEASRLVDFAGSGDVSADGTEFVALAIDADGARRYQAWSTETLELIATIEADDVGLTDDDPSGAAAFAGGHVLTTWRVDGEHRVLDLDRVSGTHDEVAAGVQEWAVSEDGDTLVANVRNSDLSADFGTCAYFQTPATPPGITDCRSRFYDDPALSPSGQRTVTVDARTDGFGPGGFDVVETSEAQVVATVVTPGPTLDGHLLGEDELMVLAAKNYDARGRVVSVCDLAGSCEEIFRSTDSDAVLGS